MELELDFFVQFIVYFHIVANQVFDPAVPFRASFEQKLSPRRYDKLHMFNRTRLCLLCVMQIMVARHNGGESVQRDQTMPRMAELQEHSEVPQDIGARTCDLAFL